MVSGFRFALMQKHQRIEFFCLFVLALLVDQGVKWLAQVQGLMVLNMGVSFGWLPVKSWTLIVTIVWSLLLLRLGRSFFLISPGAAGLFFGASLSNILDRWLWGGVRDFLPVPILGVTNNIADWVIVLSLVFLALKSLRSTSPTS